MASNGALIFQDDAVVIYPWGNMLLLTSFIASMVVNALVTGLIAFKILKVFLEVKPTSAEQTFGSLNSTRGPKLRRIIFIIIESGMALFAIQLVRVLLEFLPLEQEPFFQAAYDIVAFINQMLNVIIIKSVRLYFFCLADNIYLTRASHQR